MAVRNKREESVADFLGLNTTDDATNLPPEWWQESNNVIVSSSGSAVALRSPLAWNTVPGVATGVSSFSWNRAAGSLVLYDEIITGSITSFRTSGGANTAFGTTYSGALKYKRLNVNDKAYGVQGQTAMQYEPASFTEYLIGLAAPAAAPTVSIVAGGTLTLNVGVTVSYAYRNSTTVHVGKASAASAASGTTAGGNTLRVAVVASGTGGVDGIVLFITTDGGGTRYLVVDANGAPIVYSNSTANIDITAAFLLDTNTVETAFSDRPRDTARFMFAHQNRIFMCNFNSAATRWQLIYSGLEAIGIGQPTEAYPPFNIIGINNKAESVQGGISTQVGALIMTDKNSYLLQGTVSDNVVTTQNTIQNAAVLQELKWGLGTRSPFTIVDTPFGIVWLDQTKRIQLWPFSGLPREIGLPLRNELKAIQDTDALRLIAEATWFQYGEMQYYVLTASTSGSTNNKLFIIGVYEDPATRELKFSTGVSDIAFESIITHIDQSGVAKCLGLRRTNPITAAADGGMKSILDLATAGGGWASSQTINFGVTCGNFKNSGNFTHLHSIRFDSQVGDIQVQTRNMNDSNIEAAPTEQVDQSYFALLDRYGVHQKLKFVFPADDTARREVRNLRITYSAKGRSI